VDTQQLEDEFQKNFSVRGEVGAAVSVWRHGVEVLSLFGGQTRKEGGEPWGQGTLVPVYSATKGPAAAVVLVLLEEAGLEPVDEVAEVWPEFAQNGKARFTFAEMLSHQAGVAALDEPVSIFDHAAVVRALEEQCANWQPGSGHGYHPRTSGFLLEELARRLGGGKSLGQSWRERFGVPLGLDFWIGLQEGEFGRVAQLYPGKATRESADTSFYQAFNDPGSLTRRAFASPRGLQAVAEMNTPKGWRRGLPSMGGTGSARGLAKFYAALANRGVIGGVRVCSETVLGWMGGLQISGQDLVLLGDSAFTCGFMKDPEDGSSHKKRRHFGPSRQAFGHPGAGGSHAFADPENGTAFAYVMNQMELGVLPGERPLSLVRALYSE